MFGSAIDGEGPGRKGLQGPVKEIGWHDVSLTRIGSRDPLFSDLPKTFPVFQWHEDTFDIPRAGKLIATSSPISHQAFRYGENAYGLQFHLEVTEEMVTEWVEAYEKENGGGQAPLFSRAHVLTETEIKIETHTRRGMKFLENFFGR